MARNKISEKNLWDHLTKIFIGTVHSIANQDAEFFSEYAETNFGNLLLQKSQNLWKNGYKVFFGGEFRFRNKNLYYLKELQHSAKNSYFCIN